MAERIERVVVGAVVAGAWLSRCCFGVTVSIGPGAGGSVPLANVSGPGAFQSSLTVSDTREVNSVSVLLTSLVHAWMGELSAWVTHVPSGRTALLFDRIGSSIAVPKGDSSDFVGHYTFADGGASLATAAASTGATSPIPTGSYGASGSGGAAVSLAGVFGGISAAGEWRLSMRNHGPSDVGTLGSWTLGLDVDEASSAIVPLPSAGGLGAAGVLLVGLRRRRR